MKIKNKEFLNKSKTMFNMIYLSIFTFVATYSNSALANVGNKEVISASRKNIDDFSVAMNWLIGVLFVVTAMLAIAAYYINAYKIGKSISEGNSSKTNEEFKNLTKLFMSSAIATGGFAFIAIIAKMAVPFFIGY